MLYFPHMEATLDQLDLIRYIVQRPVHEYIVTFTSFITRKELIISPERGWWWRFEKWWWRRWL